jgi:hypothetical protein
LASGPVDPLTREGLGQMIQDLEIQLQNLRQVAQLLSSAKKND